MKTKCIISSLEVSIDEIISYEENFISLPTPIQEVYLHKVNVRTGHIATNPIVLPIILN